jgi:hypothetical protein
VPRPVQLNSRLIEDIGGISGYARACRPMALSLPAVVGAAESTVGGEAGSAVYLKPRCRSSFDEWLGRLRRLQSRSGMASPAYPHSSEIEIPANTGIVFCRETLMIQNERGPVLLRCEKIERDPESDPRFCRAGNFSRAAAAEQRPDNRRGAVKARALAARRHDRCGTSRPISETISGLS